MLPTIRSLISVPAGIERMALGFFLFYTTLGRTVWNPLFVIAGYQLGERFELVEQYAEMVKHGVIALLVIAVTVFVVPRIHRRFRERGNRTPPESA